MSGVLEAKQVVPNHLPIHFSANNEKYSLTKTGMSWKPYQAITWFRLLGIFKIFKLTYGLKKSMKFLFSRQIAVTYCKTFDVSLHLQIQVYEGTLAWKGEVLFPFFCNKPLLMVNLWARFFENTLGLSTTDSTANNVDE